MITKLVYLQFKTPVRFGKDKGRPDLTETGLTCHADTLFSALAIEWRCLYGEAALADFFQLVDKGQLRMSDLLPYAKGSCFLPKPLKLFHSPPPDQIKAVKKLDYLAVEDFQAFCQNGQTAEGKTPGKTEFAEVVYQVRVNKRDQAEPLPYHVAALRFFETAGLYCLLQFDEALEERLLTVFESLGETGIGGKRSSGFGKFELKRVVNLNSDELSESEQELSRLLELQAGLVMNLSLVLPGPGDLGVLKDPQSAYQFIKRSGFTTDLGIKHSQVGMINIGSCLPERIDGQLVNLAPSGAQPVYRYGLGLYIGVPYE